MVSILVYSCASAACAFFPLRHAIGGVSFCPWPGHGRRMDRRRALIAETWRPEHRGKALGLMQSAYAIGESDRGLGGGARVAQLCWRAVFLVGVFAGPFVFWIRSSVPEPTLWSERRSAGSQRPPLRRLLSGKVLRTGLLATRHEHLRPVRILGLVYLDPRVFVSPAGARRARTQPRENNDFLPCTVRRQFVGYAAFGFLADAFGRRKPYFTYLLIAPYSCQSTEGQAAQPCCCSWDLSWHSLERDFSQGMRVASEIFPGEIRAASHGAKLQRWSRNLGSCGPSRSALSPLSTASAPLFCYRRALSLSPLCFL